jgi:hypothetical protein
MRTEVELLVGSVFFLALVFFIGFGLGAIIGHKLSLYRSCQGAFRKCLKEKLVRASLLVWEWCNN